ncbi:hypothetical protein D5400_16870 [Georhizobium profundi]|uniref:Uncharacterized protein n=1 Tax=Georhizobium profundi TaxID=2341112 RepID=A0A3S9B710_9HYPH|nr:hypothetical protein [Georhizobium profundi]AZN72723.1 hypothetical protein D5400_16870 [Georhizobium profundi]
MLEALMITMLMTLPDCTRPNRAERGLTCLVDGDTGLEGGRNWRYEGIDTPEISRPDFDENDVQAIHDDVWASVLTRPDA